MIIPLNGYIIVEVDKEYEDSIKVGDLDLILIPGTMPGEAVHQAREFGHVVAVSGNLPKHLKTTMDLIVGDKVYFHYHSLIEDNNIKSFYREDQKVYKIFYSEIYCAIRDGKPYMLSDHVLVSPTMDTPEETHSKSGIQLRSDIEPKPIMQRGKIEHKRHDEESFDVGDEIIYSKHSDVDIVVEGVSYYRMKGQDILGTILN